MLTVLLLVWVIFRVVTWAPLPFEGQFPHRLHDLAEQRFTAAAPAPVRPTSPPVQPVDALPRAPFHARAPLPPSAPPPPAWQARDPYVTGGQQLLWLAGLSQLPVPETVATLFERRADSTPDQAGGAAPASSQQPVRRWSVDGWLFLRQGGGQLASAGPFGGTYGASQAGVVARYRLFPSDGHRLSAYMRGYKALGSGGEAELAAGFAARPLPSLPLAANVEMRATQAGGNTRLRPAAFATTELPPVTLPLDMRAELYGQAGYVGGEQPTAFADGQLRVDRELAQFDLGDVRAGAGAWGGAQKGAARLDIGPAANVGLKIGGAPARLSVDYRVRVAGDAQPGSGLAVTLSAGF